MSAAQSVLACSLLYGLSGREKDKGSRKKLESSPADRSTKLETNSNVQKTKCSKRCRFGFAVLDFPDSGFISARFCLGPRGFFRASDFGFCFNARLTPKFMVD